AVDILLCFPAEILAIMVLVVLGQGLDKLIITIGIVMTPRFDRLSYGSTLSLKEREYIEAARSIGARGFRILFRYILPNILGEILVMSSLWTATAIRVESNLSFLGLGVAPPTPTWGNMVRAGVNQLTNAPWLSIFPGLAIMLAVLAFNLIGDGLRDVMDPKLHS
ncbi:MAG: ABC transporter permease, partial [Nitrospinota bacterium]